MGMSPVSAFHAFTWDLWLALSYAITFAIASTSPGSLTPAPSGYWRP
ncbi:hypothetical protein [Vulcanisaeta sp. JCM 16161]|nr:hypothetical protein [Vulcanisaeta sp. JCM 16161]